jgi:transposase
MGGHRKRLLEPHRALIIERLKAVPDLTLKALVAELAEHGIATCPVSVWRLVRSEGMSFKKKACSPRSRPGQRSREDASSGRNIRDGLIQSVSSSSTRADCTPMIRGIMGQEGAKTNMTPIRGWAPRGQKLVAHAPFGKWRTLTFLAALRHDRIDAPCVLDGPINGVSFTAYVEQFLIPTLSPGDIVIMDNLGSHKGQAVRKAIRAAGAKFLFLPPYSPDLNPIEQMFAKLKLLLRKAEERTVDATWQRIGSLLDAFPPNECANYLRNSGYASI